MPQIEMQRREGIRVQDIAMAKEDGSLTFVAFQGQKKNSCRVGRANTAMLNSRDAPSSENGNARLRAGVLRLHVVEINRVVLALVVIL